MKGVPTKPRKVPTLAELGALYGVSPGSVCRWKGEGLPIFDEEAMRPIIAERLARRERQIPTAEGGEQYEVSRPQTGVVTLGAAAALKRLEQDEADRYAAYQSAKEAGAQAAVVKRLHAQYLAVSESLRKYDLQIAAIRRDAGELLSRAEVEVAIAASAEALRLSAMAVAEGGVEDIVRAGIDGDYASAGAVLIELLAAQVPTSFQRMSQTVQGCPAWCLAAARRGMMQEPDA
jgi:hypothetical protein